MRIVLVDDHALFRAGVRALGLVVATGSVDRIDADGGWWFAVGALVLGIALVPWARRKDSDRPAPEPFDPVAD